MNPRNFFAELKRRNVIRSAGLYLVGAWLIVQVTSTILPAFDLPGWVLRGVIVTLAIGFGPAVIVSWVFELTPEGLKRDEDVIPEQSIAPQTARRMDRMIIALLGLALGYFCVDKFILAPRRESALLAAVSAPNEHKTARKSNSIAVLPLVNESAEKDGQYFSDGLSEDLITALSQFNGLKVIGRNSSFQFRDSKDDSKTIGAKLGVAHLLEGSVRRLGGMVRISAELVNAADGTTLWSQHFDRPYHDLFQLQDDVTSAVVNALHAKLLPSEGSAAQSDRPPSGDLAAYADYLEGNFYSRRATEADDHQSIEHYEAAIHLDPHYAAAYARLARGWTDFSAEFLSGAAAQEAYAKARAAATTALALDPNLSLAHQARGLLLQTADFDWIGSEGEYRRAVQLAPNDGSAVFGLAGALASLGQVQQAVVLTRQALTTNPLQASWYDWLSFYLSGLGRLDEAEAAIRRAIDLQPAAVSFHEQLAVIKIQRGDAKAALAAAEQEPPGDAREAGVTLALQIGPDHRAADAALQTLIHHQANNGAYQIAQVYALRGNSEQMFTWLDRAWAIRDSGIQYLYYDPFILRYKHDPRFSSFCQKVGLPAPADATAAPKT